MPVTCIILASAMSIVFGTIPLFGKVRLTDPDLSSDQKVFFTLEICAVALTFVILTSALVIFHTRRINLYVGLFGASLGTVTIVIYLCSILYLRKFNCCGGKHVLPEMAWVVGGMISDYYATLLAMAVIRGKDL
ncbi:unnamed protein product [Calicophoron daubneyi]|uniref:Uncharacterized protein n=1 Tax=Calicophoron daubneyi TaxID=300641 RepID=A0AAV2TWB4_CALDB